MFKSAESIEFAGTIVARMAQDPKIARYTSRVVIGAEYAQAHGIRDIDGRVILSYRQVRYLLANLVLPEQLAFLAYLVPGFFKIPQFVIDISFSKF